MALAPLNIPALSLATMAALLAGGAATGAVLAHALRKARSHDWVVALGWGSGGAFAVGTGLWVLQLALWHAMQDPAAPWFVASPFVAAWMLAVAGCAAADADRALAALAHLGQCGNRCAAGAAAWR